MALTKEEKTKVITENRLSDNDTGSCEVQIMLLTAKIKKLTTHMTNNKHDYSSKRGMDIIIARRKKLLKYLKSVDQARYEAVMQKIKPSK